METVHTVYKNAETLTFTDVITLKILLSGSQTNGQSAIFEDIVMPGMGPGRHIHHEQDEIFLFLEGEFIAEVDGIMYSFSPGDVAFIPKGSTHAFKNIGTSVGKLRYIFTPALTIESMFREMYAAFQNDGSLSFETMSKISLNHGQEFVGPPL